MASWTHGPHVDGLYMVFWGVLTLALVPFADSTPGMVVVGVFGLAFSWYGVGRIRTG